MYGSNFCMVTFKPLDLSKTPNEAEVIPLPKDETTPPVIKIYLVLHFVFKGATVLSSFTIVCLFVM